MEIRSLRESDDRSLFSSGDPDLDRFLKPYAGQNQFRHHIGTTYVAVEDDRILGYATVSPGHIEVEDLPASVRKRFPRYPLPILRLGRLAVDASARGKGVGKGLLRFVLGLAARLATDYGCVGVIVDAKQDAESFYQSLGFMPLQVLEGRSPIRPVPIAMFLPMSEIQTARKKRSRK